MINAINAARQVRTRHRGNRVFSKGVLRRNGGKFPEGGTQEAEEQPRQSCAKEPQVSGLAMLEKSVFFGGQQGWG